MRTFIGSHSDSVVPQRFGLNTIQTRFPFYYIFRSYIYKAVVPKVGGAVPLWGGGVQMEGMNET